MKKGQKKKRDRQLKKRTERKAGLGGPHTGASLPGRALMRGASRYPLLGCWAQENWHEGGLAVVTVARQAPGGAILCANYLVDYYCLGLKDTMWKVGVTPTEFREALLPSIYRAASRPVEISAALAHEIIYGAIAYAEQFGFRPHRDFRVSRELLDPPEAHPASGRVTFGHEGKPFYISGPYDNVRAIVDQLMRTAGEGNFHYMVGLSPNEPDDSYFLDADELEEGWDEGEGRQLMT